MAKRLQPEEWEYIRTNCLTKTDEEMADYLKRRIVTVAKARKKLGIQKGKGGRVQELNIHNPNAAVAVTQANAQLTDNERKEYFKTQFINSLYYQNLKEQFTKNEIDFYLEEWASLCLQFEDIVATEKRQIDEYIKMTLMGFRILRNINSVEEEIKSIQNEIEDLRKSHPDMEKDPLSEELRERDQSLMSLVMAMNGQSKAMAVDYQRNLELRTKLLGELNARRKDRIDQITKRDKTFLGLLQEFRHREVRETQGRRLELMRLAKEKKKGEWRKPIRYIDNNKDCILLDEHSEIPKADVVYMDAACKTAQDFGERTDAKILVVDDDTRRLQFFSEIFKGNKLEFVSNADKAFEKLKGEKYDLICLDYDLGLEQKGTAVAEHLLTNGSSPDGRILIHSMNKNGAKELYNRLRDHRQVEAYPFEDLVKSIGETNAKSSNISGEDAGDSSDEDEE